MAVVNVTVSQDVMLRLVKDAIKDGHYTIKEIATLSNVAANEVYRRDPSKIDGVFRNSKRLYVRYWAAYKSPLALRRKREAAIAALQELNAGVTK